MASLDVFVHPGELETFGQTLQEAHASGVPVVAPAAGGPLDIVRHSHDGWLYPPGDHEALRARVVDLVGDERKRRAFGPRRASAPRAARGTTSAPSSWGTTTTRSGCTREPAQRRYNLRIVHVANFYSPSSRGNRELRCTPWPGSTSPGGTNPCSSCRTGGTGWTHVDGVRVVSLAAPRVPFSGGYRAVVRPGKMRGLLETLAPDRLEVSDRTTLAGLGDWAREAGIPSLMMLHERVDGVLRSWLPGGAEGG